MQRTETIPNRRAVIVANGVMSTNTDLESLLRAGDLLIAADGGGRYCLQAGCMPHILIGDFDSLSVAKMDQLEASSTEIFRHPMRKDETDLELALDLAINRKVHEIIILAALGGRWDHTMANLLLLGLPRFSVAHIRLLDGNQEITMLRPRAAHVIRGSPGDTVSLIPINGDANKVTTSGLEYQLQTGGLPFGATLGVSNIMTEPEATISLQDGLLICIVIHNPRRR